MNAARAFHFFVVTLYSDGSDVNHIDEQFVSTNRYHSFRDAEMVQDAINHASDKTPWIIAARCECDEEDKDDLV